MSLCKCGCGGEAEPGREYINGHNSKSNHPMKGKHLSEESKQKMRETKRINKEIKEGKRPAPELPFCACGCGGRVTKLGNKYIYGHNMRGKNKGKDNPMYGVEPWNKGETKETDIRVREYGEKVSITKKEFFETEEGKKSAKEMGRTKREFFATEEGQQWLDENMRDINSPRYGKGSWNKGENIYTDDRVKKYGESSSKTKKEFFATDKGQEWIEEHMKGENSPMYGKGYLIAGEKNGMYGVEPWSKGKTKDDNESLKIISEKMMGDKNPSKRPEVREKISVINTEKYANGELIPWNKGKTKDDNEILMVMSENSRKKWQDPEFIKMMTEAWNKKPTKPEKDIDDIVQLLFHNEYKYNGNFELGITIGGKIPDFVNVNGKKKAIDMFGDWCHRDEDPQIRINFFKKYGWDLLVIWQHELKDKDAVIQKILKFHGVESDYVIPQRTLDKWIKNENNQK